MLYHLKHVLPKQPNQNYKRPQSILTIQTASVHCWVLDSPRKKSFFPWVLNSLTSQRAFKQNVNWLHFIVLLQITSNALFTSISPLHFSIPEKLSVNFAMKSEIDSVYFFFSTNHLISFFCLESSPLIPTGEFREPSGIYSYHRTTIPSTQSYWVSVPACQSWPQEMMDKSNYLFLWLTNLTELVLE